MKLGGLHLLPLHQSINLKRWLSSGLIYSPKNNNIKESSLSSNMYGFVIENILYMFPLLDISCPVDLSCENPRYVKRVIEWFQYIFHIIANGRLMGMIMRGSWLSHPENSRMLLYSYKLCRYEIFVCLLGKKQIFFGQQHNNTWLSRYDICSHFLGKTLFRQHLLMVKLLLIWTLYPVRWMSS